MGVSPSSSPRAMRHHHATIEETEGELLSSHEEMEYFRPKRALELLAEGVQMRERGREGHSKWGGSNSIASPTVSADTSNAAAVHGLETILAADPHLARRPGRLQSLSLLSQGGEGSEGGGGERRGRRRSKRHSLEPITDANKRPPPDL